MIILEVKAKGAQPRRGFAYFWDLMLSANKAQKKFTFRDICNTDRGVSQPHEKDLLDFVKRLVKSGHLSVETRNEVVTYTLEKPQRMTPRIRRDGTVVPNGQQQIWNAIRQLRNFTATELFRACATDDHAPKLETVKAYLNTLVTAGILNTRPTETKVKPWAYSLVRAKNTGPLAPQILRSKAVFDPNRKKLFTSEIEAKEAQ